MKKIIFTENAPLPIGAYSQAILVGETLYCSGQIALCTDGGDCLNGSVSEQTEQICLNIAAVLAAAEMTMQDVVKTTCFLADMADFAEFNEVYGKHFSHKPARSCVAAKSLPKGAKAEIEVIAVK